MTLPIRLALAFLLCLLGSSVCAKDDPVAIVRTRCLDCHGQEDPAGGVNLAALIETPSTWQSSDDTDLWTRVEKMVAAKRMPPEDAEPLEPPERATIVRWYQDTFVLRDGKEHHGPTPLRRLTRYELENTLEDLLHVKLKQPYVFSSESAGLEPSTIEQLYPADVAGESGFDNDAERLRQVKIPLLKFAACLDFALRKFQQNSVAHQTVLSVNDLSAPREDQEARAILTRFMDRAFRGHVNEAERETVFDVWKSAIERHSPETALIHAMKATLLSPSFVYRMEHSEGSSEPYRADSHAMAVRLSYFLWSSMPDAELMRAAEADELKTDEQLRNQVRRMLNSPKRLALAENFAGQWLGFNELQRNKVYYHGENWTRGAYDELLFGFDELIKSDLSILDIVNSDWTYLSSESARGVKAKRHAFPAKYDDVLAYRRVRTGLKVERFYSPPRLFKVADDRLGGFLTAAGVMRLTSAPNRTNPIRRGVWVLENIIGEQMHPPENIPPLAEAEKKVSKSQSKDPAEILKVHTAQQSCRVCHQHIDPLGLGLENFDPKGKWRTSYANQLKIAARGVLPNGREFDTPKQLKQELLDHYRDRIVDNMIRKMLAYALGRELQPFDRPSVERIYKELRSAAGGSRELHEELQGDDYRMGALIEQIVLSDVFRNRQD